MPVQGADIGRKSISVDEFLIKSIDEKNESALKDDLNKSNAMQTEALQTRCLRKTISSRDHLDDADVFADLLYIQWNST